jgi:hypothetical protein
VAPEELIIDVVRVDTYAGVELVDAVGEIEAGSLILQHVEQWAKQALVLADAADRGRRGEGLAEGTGRDGQGPRVLDCGQRTPLDPCADGWLGEIEHLRGDRDRYAVPGMLGALDDGDELRSHWLGDASRAERADRVSDIDSKRDVGTPVAPKAENPFWKPSSGLKL